MIDVARFAARTSGVAYVTIISTLSRTNSAANSAARSLLPSAQRYSDDEVATLDPAEFTQPLQKNSDPTSLACGHRYRAQESDSRQLSRLLPPRRERPGGRRAAEQRDEMAASCVEHGLPSRNPLCQLTAGSGCPESGPQVLGVDLNRSESRRQEACPSMRPARAPDFYVFMSGQRGAFPAMRRISAAPQSRPWCARRGGTGHSAHQERRRYCLRRRVINVEPDQSQIKTV